MGIVNLWERPLVISPLLANLFMHYAFDRWMAQNYPQVQFARYADDVVVHAKTKEEAERLLDAIRERLKECLSLTTVIEGQMPFPDHIA
jgi:retron-type reverse transcriptase